MVDLSIIRDSSWLFPWSNVRYYTHIYIYIYIHFFPRNHVDFPLMWDIPWTYFHSRHVPINCLARSAACVPESGGAHLDRTGGTKKKAKLHIEVSRRIHHICVSYICDICMFNHVLIFICVYMYIYIYIIIFVYIYIYIFVHICLYIYIYIYSFTYT